MTLSLSLSLDFTPCTLDARPLTQGKPGFPAHMIISDQGSEFKSEFQEFLRTMKIKQKMQKSYTPQPHIEAVDGVLRNIIRSHVIRTGSKTLNHDIMEKLMKAKNTNTDPDSRTTPESLMKDYFSRNSNDILTYIP